MDEFDLIEKLIRKETTETIAMGRGDDCSVVHWSDRDYLIETSDCLVEDVHFRLRDFNFSELAYKALAVNLSDIAAMGGRPTRAHLNLALPKKIQEFQVKSFFESFYELADRYSVRLVGGDCSKSPGPVFVSFHLTGWVPKDQIQWRSELGQPGVLCVTGFLGDSGAGFQSLEKALDEPQLIAVHKRPPIELSKAQWLARQPGVAGMMDLSDGLHSDLQRIPQGNITIDLERLPISPELQSWCERYNEDPIRWALCGGEDYRLLVRVDQDNFAAIARSYQATFGANLVQVGFVDASTSPSVQYRRDGKVWESPWTPFRHF